jgi:hypothetical protein
MFYMQGEANYVGGLAMGETPGTYTASGYSALLLQLYSDMCNDLVTTILGQARLPPMFVTQTSSGWDTWGLDQSTIGMGQLNACLQNPNIYMAGPYYQMPDDPGGSQHLTGDGYAWLGSQVGKVMHKVIDSGQGWLPLYPTSVLYRGNQILVTFHVPEPPLVFDTPYVVTTLTDFAAKGFNVYDADGSHSISSVSIVGSSTVLITVASPINGTLSPMLQYAGKATFSGTGCLRDSDPTMSDTVSSLTGLQFHLANWCVGFNLPITAG